MSLQRLVYYQWQAYNVLCIIYGKFAMFCVLSMASLQCFVCDLWQVCNVLRTIYLCQLFHFFHGEKTLTKP